MSFVLLFRRIEGQETSPNPPIASWLVSVYSAGGLEPSVAQPPLPLQEFSPLQPLSPDLQPPLPLQEFWPLQACFSLAWLSSFLSFPWSWLCSWALKEAFSAGSRVEALTAAPLPAIRPANAAPASMAFVVFVIFKFSRRFRMRRGTPSGHSVHLGDRESCRRFNRTSFCCDFGCGLERSYKLFRPLNETRGLHKGFRHVQQELDSKLSNGRAA